jgi:hypothetical protein
VASIAGAYIGQTNFAICTDESSKGLLRAQSTKKCRPQIVPSAYSKETVAIHGFAAENVDAFLKSVEILSRGIRAVNSSAHGTASMTLDDGLSAFRALMGCRTLPEWIDLQSELVKLNSGRVAIRALLLSVMSVQVTEEALFPLIRRANAAFGLVSRTMAA